MYVQCAFCQDSLSIKTPNTELERVQVKIGAVLKKEFIEVFTYKPKGLFSSDNFDVNILNLTDASTGFIVSGLAISTVDLGTSYQSVETYSSFIDLDEIPGLLRFIDLLEKQQSDKPVNYTEYVFNSKDLQLYSYYNTKPIGKKQQPGWTYVLKADRYYSRSAVSVDLKIFIDLRDAIINSKSKFAHPLNL
jgi:hypothetical protein